uniref:Uncharacterized protein n=1 Tax=Arundo donax TaxID=35708 RepID=A0A0A9F9Y3_ARUDO
MNWTAGAGSEVVEAGDRRRRRCQACRSWRSAGCMDTREEVDDNGRALATDATLELRAVTLIRRLRTHDGPDHQLLHV